MDSTEARYLFDALNSTQRVDPDDLDINTPEGQKTRRDELVIVNYLGQRVEKEGWRVHETPKTRPARLDGMFCKDGRIGGIYEIKCRYNLTENMLRYGFGGEGWLISYEKIVFGRMASVLFSVPFYGILYLVDEDKMLVWQITDDEGRVLVPMTVRQSETKKTCNGGLIVRENAYLPVKGAKKIKMIERSLYEPQSLLLAA